MATEIQTVPIPATLEQRAMALKVFDSESRVEAEDTVRTIKALKKEVESFFAPLVEAAHASHKALTTKRAENVKPLEKMESDIKAKLLAYAREQAEIERAAKEREQAEMRRQAQEAADRQAQLDAEALEAEKFGATELAEEIKAEANAAGVRAFTIEKASEKVAPGKPEGTREKWCWRVVDKSLVPPEYLVPDKDKLNYMAMRKKGSETIPGIEFYPDYIPVVRG